MPEGQQQSGDPEGTPLSFEQSQMQQQEENPQPLVVEGGEPIPVTLGGAEREYIWGPGDGPAGIDEILVQFDINRAPWWMLQDAGGDLVAMCDIGGSGVGGSARVVHTYQFDAYGQCLRATQLVANSTNFTAPYTRLGHKGLFLDRIDVGVASGNSTSGFFDNPRVVGGGYGSGGTLGSPTGSVVRYQVRNRTYLPEFGLWGQRDPNASGQRVFDGLVFHGVPIISMEPELGVEDLYGNGGSLRQYCESRPGMGYDPDGLEFSVAFQMATMANDAWSNVEGQFETALQGMHTIFGLYSMLQSYRVFQNVDADWATDWSIDDEGSTHSQSFRLGIGVWADEENDDGLGSESAAGPAIAASLKLGAGQNRATYNSNRAGWSSVRRNYWKDLGNDEKARAKCDPPFKPSDVERMKQGLAPKGWIIHHRRPLASGGSNSRGNLVPMRSTDHNKDFNKLHKPPYPLPDGFKKLPVPTKRVPTRIR